MNSHTYAFLFVCFSESGRSCDVETPAGAENVYDPDHSPVQVCLSSAHPVPAKLQTYLIFFKHPRPNFVDLTEPYWWTRGTALTTLCAYITLLEVVLKVRNYCSLLESPVDYFIQDIIYFSWDNLWNTLITCKTYSNLQTEPHLTWLVCIVTCP